MLEHRTNRRNNREEVCEHCGNNADQQPRRNRRRNDNEHQLQKYWRPSVAVIYLITVVFDFIAMPLYIEGTNRRDIDYALIDKINSLKEPATQIEIARKLEVSKRTWEPLTLLGGGLFHLAFGSILTGAAVTRGLEKQNLAKLQWEQQRDYNYNRYGNGGSLHPHQQPNYRNRYNTGAEGQDPPAGPRVGNPIGPPTVP